MGSHSPKDVVMIGAGASAEVLAYYLDRMSDLNLVGFTVDRQFLTETEFLHRPVVVWDDLKREFPPDEVRLIGPPTYARLNRFRRDRYFEGKAAGYEFASYCHPNSVIMTEKIGDHCIILHGVTILPETEVSENVVIWCDTHVGHHCVIGAHSFLSSHVGIAGHTTIGEECYLAGKVGITNGRKVGARCAIMNAALIKADVADDSVITGPEAITRPFKSERIRRLF